ncbi:MAG: right-handed parallel beta-helix repeat-containing protein [Bacteroidetes bacterium]|nr:right-handed parallel beta-helix repeat-containing protein [Bacteroidota bacterium]
MKRNKTYLFSLLITAILVFLWNINVFSKEYLVDISVNKNDLKSDPIAALTSIQKAIDIAFDGDTIRVAKGIYEQDLIYINKSIVLLGCQSGIAPRSVDNRKGGECIIINSLEPYQSIVIDAPRVIIDGFKFGSDNELTFNGIYINADHVKIQNCVISNSSSCGIYISANAQNSEISYNLVQGSSLEGILNVADGVLILNNYIHKIQEFSAISTTRRSTIVGNIISDVAENGISLLQPEAILSLVFGNEISNTGNRQIFYCLGTPPADTPVVISDIQSKGVSCNFKKEIKSSAFPTFDIPNTNRNQTSFFGVTSNVDQNDLRNFTINMGPKVPSQISIHKL